MRGSKSARVGFLFTASNHTSESSLLLVKVFEISASLHRFVSVYYCGGLFPPFLFGTGGYACVSLFFFSLHIFFAATKRKY